MNNTCILNPYEEIEGLFTNENFEDAEHRLKLIKNKTAYWYFLYSKILIHKAWFDTAKSYLEKAISMDPNNAVNNKALIEFMARNDQYHNRYNNSRRRRRSLDCCCCDDCCEFSCCDLICLDTCCECMGGDLIDCI